MSRSEFDIGTKWTDTDKEQALRGYVEIPREKWEMISPGTHMMYSLVDGGFRKGGFVSRNPVMATSKIRQTEENAFQFKSGGKQGDFVWYVIYDDLTNVYVKPDIFYLTLKEELTEIIDRLVGDIDGIKADISALNVRAARR